MSPVDTRHRELLRVLTDHGVDFVLVGGVALQVHGFSGSTLDIDIVIRVESPSDLLTSKEAAGREKDLQALPQIRAELLRTGALDQRDVRGPVAALPSEASPDPRAELRPAAHRSPGARALGPRGRPDPRLSRALEHFSRRARSARRTADRRNATRGPHRTRAPAGTHRALTVTRRIRIGPRAWSRLTRTRTRALVVMTSHELWGTFRSVPQLSIYQLHRENGEFGVHPLPFLWDGHVLHELEQGELLV